MKKSVKKGNVITRRRIRKTIASLFMATAIVVASLPVENTGKATLAATTGKSSINLTTLYDDYLSYYLDTANYGAYYFPIVKGNISASQAKTSDWSNFNSTNYTNRKANDAEVTATISRGLLEWTYLYKDRQSQGSGNYEGIIVGYNPSKIRGNVQIDSSAYKDAWIITPGVITAFRNKLANGGTKETYTYSITKSADAVQCQTKGAATAADPTSSTYTVKIPAVISIPNPTLSNVQSGNLDLTSVSEETGTNYASGKGTTQKLYDDWYGTGVVLDIGTISQQKAASFSENTTVYKDWANQIADFNAKQIALVAEIENAETITPTISSSVTELKNLYSNIAASIAITIDNFDRNSNYFYEYLCYRTTIKKGANKTIPLENFTLSQVVDRIHYSSNISDTFYSYVPTLKSGETVSTSYTLDKNDDGNSYLMTGSITLGGIGNEVFKGNTTISGLELADTISFIGNSAFEGTNLTSVSVISAEEIGNKAFYGCNFLTELKLSNDVGGSSVNYIGAQAFDGTSLTDVQIPNSVSDILPGAFANCSKLKNVDFNITANLNIWPFAFFNAAALEKYSFPDASVYSNTIKLGLASFALPNDAGGGKLENFSFPYLKNNIIAGTNDFEITQNDFFNIAKSNGHFGSETTAGGVTTPSDLGYNWNNKEFMYNYILGGRSNLTHVTFPANMGGSMSSSDGNLARIPDDTLYGCKGLEYITLGSCNENTDVNQDCVGLTYDTPANDSEAFYDKDGHTLLQDVTNETFYVEGPGEYSDSTYANPRTTTWKAETSKSDSVPYKFYYKDSSGNWNVCMEVSNGKFISNFIVLDDGTAELVSYKLIDPKDTSNLGKIKIESTVCGYTISAIREGCFEKINTQVQELEIQDGCAISIEPEAFKNCKDLRVVTIGNAVTGIGKDAFSGCIKLENVYFNMPITVTDDSSSDEWEDALYIEEGAFATDSNYLTFHGKIHSGYQAFEYAMSPENTVNSGNRNICYKTDEPTNLTVIVDRTNGNPTLVDYPHYEDVDVQNPKLLKTQKSTYSTISNYSILMDWENGYYNNHSAYSSTTSSADVATAVENTLMMTIPDGVVSIDFDSYKAATENQYNLYYLRTYYYNDESKAAYKVNDVFYNYSRGLEDTDYKLRNVNDNTTLPYKNVEKLYSDDDYFKDTSDTNYFNSSTKDKNDNYSVGLFSGHFLDKNKKINDISIDATTGAITRTTQSDAVGLYDKAITFNKASGKITRTKMLEEVENGNDDLITITFKSLTDIPDYAFYSCENLMYVDLGEYFGEDMDDTCELPFAGCTSLDAITFDGALENDYFIYANGILYRKGLGSDVNGIPSDKLEIVEVLEGRGNTDFADATKYNYDIAKSVINRKNDPLLVDVVSINDGAFRNNKYLTEIDLSETEITKVPDYCFYGDEKLSSVQFPDTLESIEEFAFIGCTTRKQIYFDTPYVTIAESAFDSDSGATFHGDAYSDSEHTHASAIKVYADRRSYIDFEEVATYKVKLYNYNAELLAIRSVQVDESSLRGGSIDDKELQTLEEKYCVRTGYTFTGWAWDKDGNLDTVNDVLSGKENQNTILNNITEDRVLVAQYEPTSVVSDGKSYTLTVANGTILTSGKTSDTILSGSPVAIVANTGSNGKVFSRWSSEEISLDDTTRFNSKLTFIMPTKDATITAVYTDGNGNSSTDSGSGGTSGGSSDSGSSGTDSGSDSKTEATTYDLTVNYGSGTGKYKAGDVVTITAYAPESPNKVFSKWTAGTTSIAFANATSSTTTLVMPASAQVVTANYKTRTSDDDDDDDSDAIKRRQDNSIGTNTTTTTVTTTTGVTPADNTTVNNTPVNNDDKLIINKNGVSNKDVGSANVEGSTDNFIVRITDSDEATAAAQDALRNRFGTLDGIVYFPMDISLYDSTGTYKIADTYGLDVSVTMPIPDTLIQYGGNAKIAAADNGYLQNLNAKFTTIDGIACMTFTPPHFSPYVIYVDTNNLIAGLTYDNTPQTGDPIHPKWFLALGFACMSIFLFAKGDRKKKLPVHA